MKFEMFFCLGTFCRFCIILCLSVFYFSLIFFIFLLPFTVRSTYLFKKGSIHLWSYSNSLVAISNRWAVLKFIIYFLESGFHSEMFHRVYLRCYMQYICFYIYSVLLCVISVTTLYFASMLVKSAVLNAIVGISISGNISISVSMAPRSHLLLSGSAAALGELAVVVHGGGSAARRFTALSSFRVQHPPRAFPRALVLYAHEPAVQRQIVTNRVL